MNITRPSMEITVMYGTVSSLVGLIDIYLFIVLIIYELFYPKKPKGGRTLRVLCLVAVFVAIIHEILQQLILALADRSDMNCFALMLVKATLLSAVVSLTYAFLWLRQHSIYSNPRLRYLWGKKLNIVKWGALAVISINPILMFGFQFMGDRYKVIDGVCVVQTTGRTTEILLGILCFSYSIVQGALLFIYFYPLCKNGGPFKNTTTKPIARNHVTYTVSSNCRQGSVLAIDPQSSPIRNTELQLPSNSRTDPKSTPTRSVVTDSGVSPGRVIQQKQNFQKSMKKWLIISCICILTDVGSALVITLFLFVAAPGSIITIFFLWHDISMVISVLCMAFCFGGYSHMLLPFLWFSKIQRTTTNV